MRRAVAVLITMFLATMHGSAEHAEPVAGEYEFRWLLPDVAYAGHPIHVAYALVEQENPLVLTGHVNVELDILLDGNRILWTDSVHEHDGFHVLTVSPATAGALELVARTAAGEWRAEIEVRPGVQSAWAATSETAFLVSEYNEYTVETRQPADNNGTRRGPRNSAPPSEAPWSALFDARDSQGRTLLSTWLDGRGATAWVDGLGGPVFTSAFVSSSPAEQDTVGGALIPGPFADANVNLSGSTRTPRPCDSWLVVDPVPVAAQGIVIQEWTDLRMTAWDSGPISAEYVLGNSVLGVAIDADGQPSAIWDSARAHGGAYGQVTLRAPGPGLHDLTVWAGASGLECTLPVTVLAGREPAGTATANITVSGSTAAILFTPLDSTGSPIPHYEFDTRVFHMPNGPGQDVRLVWMGKLHGHDGPADFRLENLLPGKYLIETSPSPQGPDAPPLASDAGGFAWDFEIVAATTMESEGTEAPGAALALLIAALAVGAAARRRV